MATSSNDNRHSTRSPLYVFFHVSKTGGTSFTNHIAELFSDRPEVIPMLNSHQQQLALSKGAIYWTEKPLVERLRATYVAGHSAGLQAVTPLRPWRRLEFLTLFREPTSRFISVFNYLMHQGLIAEHLTPEEFFSPSYPDQCQITFLLNHFLGWNQGALDTIHVPDNSNVVLDAACQALEVFRFIGLYEQYRDHMTALTKYLGLPAIQQQCLVTGRDVSRRIHYTKALENHLRASYPIEYRFFERVQEHIHTNGSPFFVGDGEQPHVTTFPEREIATRT